MFFLRLCTSRRGKETRFEEKREWAAIITGGRVLFTLKEILVIQAVIDRRNSLMITGSDGVGFAAFVGIVVSSGDETRFLEVRPGSLGKATIATETTGFTAC